MSDLYKKILNVSSDAICVVGFDGVVQYANKSTSSLFGYDISDIEHSHVRNLIPEIDSKTTQTKIIHKNIDALHSSGAKFAVELSIEEVFEKDNNFYLYTIKNIEQEDHGNNLKTIIDSMNSGIWKVYVQDSTVKFDQNMYDKLGMGMDDGTPTDLELALQLIHEDDRGNFRQTLLVPNEARSSVDVTMRVYTTAGKMLYLQSFISYSFDDNDDLEVVTGLCWDVSEKVRLENFINNLSQVQMNFLSSMDIDKSLINTLKFSLEVTQSTCGFIGVLDKDMLLINYYNGKGGTKTLAIDTLPNQIKKIINSKENVTQEEICKTSCECSIGDLVNTDVNCSSILGINVKINKNKTIAIMCIFHDGLSLYSDQISPFVTVSQNVISTMITNYSNYQLVRKASQTDSLTGCHNRSYFESAVRSNIKKYKKTNQNKTFALLSMDLDSFKKINDIYGHKAGDEVLIEFTNRVGRVIRQHRGHNTDDVFARLGGDEFFLLCTDVESLADIELVAERISSSIQKAFIVEGSEAYSTSVSIGAVLYNNRDTYDHLFKNVDFALYDAKKRKPAICYFDDKIRQMSVNSEYLDSMVSNLVIDSEFYMLFQPIICLSDMACNKIEALIRIDSVDDVPIIDVLTAIDNKGLADKLNVNVIRKVFCELTNLNILNNNLVVSINISPVVQNLPSHLLELIGLVNSLKSTISDLITIEFEFLESAFTDFSHEDLVESIAFMKESGIRLAIDDFGVEYSSLNRVIEFKFDTLKIDKSLVDKLLNDNYVADSVFQSIFDLANNINLDTVVEGVETKEQLDKIIALGGQCVQGYYFSKPIELASIQENFLNQK